MRQFIQSLCGLAVFAAVFISWLFAFSFFNRIAIYRDRGKYLPETYLVAGAEYHRGDDGDSWWLTGAVKSRSERFVPGSSLRPPRPRSAADLLTRYPIGTKIDVLYNPDATAMLVQGESLRVLEATPSLWQEEAELRYRLGLLVLVPAPLTLGIYLTVRFLNRRHTRWHPKTNAV